MAHAGSDAPPLHTTPPQSTTVRHTFDRMTRGDYVRDAVAFVALTSATLLPWDSHSLLGDRSVLNTALMAACIVLSVLSLTTTYLHRSGVVPHWNTGAVMLTRAAMNVPLVLMVAVSIAIDMAGDSWTATGMGIGMALAFAGALLAAQPRQAELNDLPDPTKPARISLITARVITTVGVVITVVAFIFTISAISGDWGDYLSGRYQAAEVFTAFLFVLASIVLALPSWRASAASGLAVVAWAGPAAAMGAVQGILYDIVPETFYIDTSQVFETTHMGAYGLTLFLVAAGALYASPGFRAATGPVEAPRMYLAAVTYLLAASAIMLGSFSITVLVSQGMNVPWWAIMVDLVTCTLIAGLFVVAAIAAVVVPTRSRVPVAVIMGVALVLGLISTAIMLAVPYVTPSRQYVVPMVAVPIIVALAVTVPAPMRRFYSEAKAARPPASGLDPHMVAAAHSPSTPAEQLQWIAANIPALRPAVAANPATYDALVQWLAALDDPGVNEALAQRQEVPVKPRASGATS